MINVTKFQKYCTLCGSCTVVCPNSALKIQNNSITANENCTSCQKCIKNCPGYEFSYSEFNKFIFPKINKHSFYLGNYQEIFAAKSKDFQVLKKASSGGIVTAILIQALKNKLIDGVILTTLDNNKQPQTIIARTKEEVIQAAGSKYTLSSPNQILRYFQKNKKYAFVGLPCHIHGIRKLQKNKNHLAKQIVYCIGIFCGRTMYPEATTYMLQKLKLSPDRIKELNYRGGKWPKGFYVKTKNNQVYQLHKHYYDLFNVMFNPKRCLVCPDYTNEFADISIGDCWLREKTNYSTVIVRTSKGNKFYNTIKKKVIEKRIGHDETVKTHPNFRYKQGAILRGKWLKLFPKYDIHPKNYSYFKTKIFYLILRTVSINFSKKIIQKIPLKFIGFAVHFRRWLHRPSRSWTLKDVGKHWDHTEDYDDINKETYSYFRRFTDGDRLSDIPSGSYVLDICCRTANGAIYFAKQRNVHGICMDLTDKMMKIAQHAIKNEKVNFTTKKFIDYNLPAKNNEFDAVLCFETIEHIPDIDAFTKELNRVVKMYGEVLITMPNYLWEPIHWFAAITGIHHSEGPHRFLRRKQALKLIKDAGLRIKKEETTVLIPYGPQFVTKFGEKLEKIFKNTLMPLFGLRRIFICEKIANL